MRGIKSGLGLAMCYSIIKQHNGHIIVESALGEGSTFFFYLPASYVQSAPAVPDTSQTLIRGTGKILVIDDDDLVKDVLCVSLTNLGYDVVCAHEGSVAITLYEQALKSGRTFDAVIMDLTMPGGKGGEETVIKLREIDPGVKAIISSGYSHDPIMAHFKKYGFSGVVPKPYSLKMLSEVVHRVIAGDTT